MSNSVEEKSIKEQIKVDLQKAKQEGQLRTERVREIVRTAVSQAAVEFKEGSGEFRGILKEVIATVLENLQEKGKETKEEIAASIEGVVEGMSQAKREAISKSQTEIQQLQANLEAQENELHTQVDDALNEIEATGKEKSADVRSAIEAAIASLKDNEEFASMRKRYAELQAQLSILRANLAARYGEPYENVEKYLDDAKTWYENTKAKDVASGSTLVEKKQTDFEAKIGEAGRALARREKRAKQILKELLHAVTEAIQENKSSK
jgi:predicted component of type VI protein secretion system